MKVLLKSVISFFLMMSSVLFISCDKGDSDVNGGGEEPKAVTFLAKVMISPDLVDACENIKFEYKDKNGELQTETVDFTTIPVNQYVEKLLDGTSKTYDVKVWTKQFEYVKVPADVYFKPILTKKESYSSETTRSFVYVQEVTAAGSSTLKKKITVGEDPTFVINIANAFVVED